MTLLLLGTKHLTPELDIALSSGVNYTRLTVIMRGIYGISHVDDFREWILLSSYLQKCSNGSKFDE
jgi:hypothetical protein